MLGSMKRLTDEDTRSIRQDIAHLARVSPLAWLRELDLGQQPIALRDKRSSNKHRNR